MGKPFIFVVTCLLSFQCLNAQDIDTVTSDYIYRILSSNKFNKTIIDGRDSAMYCSGHIKNAIDIDAFSRDLNKSLQKHLTEDTLIVYCTMNKRATIIIKSLQSLNYKGLIIFMQDGIKGWKENKYDIVSSPLSPTSESAAP